MKKLNYACLVTMGLLASNSLMAQRISGSKVPATVINALKAKYPGATKIIWEKEKSNYEANWGGRSGEDTSVQFTPAGTFIQQVKAISPNELPSATISYIKAHYNNAKIAEAGKVTNSKGKISYEAELKGKDLVFDEKGNFISVEKE